MYQINELFHLRFTETQLKDRLKRIGINQVFKIMRNRMQTQEIVGQMAPIHSGLDKIIV